MIVSKVHGFVQNTVFSPRSARFVNSALGASFYSDYQQSAPVCTKQSFKPDFGTFSHCRTGHTNFEQFSAKCTSLWKTAFSTRDLDISPFSHWVHNFLGIFSKINEFVQNSDSSARSARFVIFLPGTTLFSSFQHSARVCTKHRFHCENKHVLSFSHWAHHFLAIFSKVHEFVQNKSFHPKVSTFRNFRTGRNTFWWFLGMCTSFYKTAFSARVQHVLSLLTRRTTF